MTCSWARQLVPRYTSYAQVHTTCTRPSRNPYGWKVAMSHSRSEAGFAVNGADGELSTGNQVSYWPVARPGDFLWHRVRLTGWTIAT